jgi:lipopolysaccharide transport system ATP-binding protein
VVDEVLAVGDAEFQKKAVGKMQDISKAEGRTVLFVSHNMVSIQNLCSRVICLEHGKVVADGSTTEIIEFYLNRQQGKSGKLYKNEESAKEVFIKSFEIITEIKTGSRFEGVFKIHATHELNVECAVTFCTMEVQPIYQIYSGHVGENFKLKKGINEIKVGVDALPLIHGTYELNLWVGTSSIAYDMQKAALNIDVQEGAIRPSGPVSSKNGYPVIQNANWNNL